MTKDHKILYDTEDISGDYAARDYIDPAEKALICMLGEKLSGMDMLDMGVGGGRTTKYFAPLVKSYLGADYAPSMIKACRQKYGRRFDFIIIDVRQMKEIDDNSFDFILFSYNGIDSFPHTDRIKAFEEIRRVLKKDGIFYFSSHNLNWTGLKNIFSLRNSLKAVSGSHKPIYKFDPGKLLAMLRLRKLNRSLNMNRHIEKLKKQKTGHLYDNSLNGRAGIYYITADEQIKQLRDSGFKEISTYSRDGIKTGDEKILNRGGWIYYLCS